MVAAAILGFVKQGDHLLMVDTVYGPSRRFCDEILPRHGVSTTYYDPLIGDGIAARGYHIGPWLRAAGATIAGGTAIPGAHVARAAGYLMQAQVECGTLCPTTMTYGAVAAMRRDAWLERDWVPRLVTHAYDVLSDVYKELSDAEREQAKGHLFAGIAVSEYLEVKARGLL